MRLPQPSNVAMLGDNVARTCVPRPPRRSIVACTASNPIARTTTTYWPLSRTGSENAPVGLTGDGSRPGGTSDRLTDAWVTGAKLYSSTTRPYTVPAPSFVWLHASADLPDGGEGKHGVGSKTSTRRKQPNSEIVSAPVRQTSKDGRLIHNQTSEQRLWPPNAPVQLRAAGAICALKPAIRRSE